MSNAATSAPWGALFDLDGVLVDSEGIYTEFWRGINERFPTGVECFEYVIKGNTLDAILSRYYPDPEIQKPILEALRQNERDMRYELFDGVQTLLQRLKAEGIPSAIVTSSNSRKMDILFEQLPQLRALITTVITDADVTRSKPDPEGYKLGASRLGVPSERCIVFEDSLAGVKAGRAAGGKVVGIATTNTREALEAWCDMVVDRPADITFENLKALIG